MITAAFVFMNQRHKCKQKCGSYFAWSSVVGMNKTLKMHMVMNDRLYVCHSHVVDAESQFIEWLHNYRWSPVYERDICLRLSCHHGHLITVKHVHVSWSLLFCTCIITHCLRMHEVLLHFDQYNKTCWSNDYIRWV
jgi:hypothetical protein